MSTIKTLWADRYTESYSVNFDAGLLPIPVTGRVGQTLQHARLIAAAPDLLAACELFTEIWRSWSDPANAAGAIFAAVAKAKGETK